MNRRQFLAQTLFLPLVAGGSLPAEPLVPYRVEGSSPDYYPWRIYDATLPAVAMPTLREIASDIKTDDGIVARLTEWFEANQVALAAGWQETNVSRLKALFGMYLIHISLPYGASPYPLTWAEFARSSASHCGPQSEFQQRLMDAWRLSSRRAGFASGLHGWVEVLIDEQWEIFDATANVWIDRPGQELLAGRDRCYRRFYSPWADLDRPDFRACIADYKTFGGPFQFTPGGLRCHMPGLGIYFFAEAYRQASGDALV